MKTFEGVQVRNIPPDEADLSQIIGGRRAWHQGRVPEPSPSPAPAAQPQAGPGIPLINSGNLQAWIEKRIKKIRRVLLADRAAASLKKQTRES